MASDSLPKHLANQVADFTGRQWVLGKVADWVSDCNALRVLLIIGEPGCGKTALAAWLAGFGSVHEPSTAEALAQIRGSWAARHFCFAEERRGSINPARFAQAIANQINERFPYFARYIL